MNANYESFHGGETVLCAIDMINDRMIEEKKPLDEIKKTNGVLRKFAVVLKEKGVTNTESIKKIRSLFQICLADQNDLRFACNVENIFECRKSKKNGKETEKCDAVDAIMKVSADGYTAAETIVSLFGPGGDVILRVLQENMPEIQGVYFDEASEKTKAILTRFEEKKVKIQDAFKERIAVHRREAQTQTR